MENTVIEKDKENKTTELERASSKTRNEVQKKENVDQKGKKTSKKGETIDLVEDENGKKRNRKDQHK